ncbi:MAG: phospho-N-acetylmuramoyl-pentapeptide-transferase [Chloroflexi bacterium]|nr:phospho-N-acetylmuramoyl-pentapeptide-transferase [Chloroflexota bacterium]MBV9897797.1 phospho-N-acetylmuramoyl-pentapeptide-transferase [Chloroflexota bacterium]
MATALSMAAMAFLITIVLGYPYLNYLRRAGLGKRIRSDGPSSHIDKTGTPTMGGLLVSVVVLALTVCLTLILYRESGRSILLPMVVMALTTLLGWYDDRMTLVGRKGEGMRARTKFALLGGIALAASFVLWDRPNGLGIDFVYLPGIKKPFEIGIWVIPLSLLAVMGSAHAVNLTDGLDSLAGHTAAVAYAAYGIIAAQYGQIYLVTFCFTVTGALLAFLWFNAHPAEVFMGDTGSLALGATLAIVAMMLGQVLLLLFIGFVFVAEAVSVMLQVVFFKLTGGRRLFRMAPLHHHFEMMGWSETQVAQRFWLISMVSGLLGVALALV